MDTQSGSDIDVLTKAIERFGEEHLDKYCHYSQGQRVINQGDTSTECFLITDGAVSILVREENSTVEKQVALRFVGDLIGEIAFLQKNNPRTASVEVVTSSASFIRITREDIFILVHDNPKLTNAIELLQQLAIPRVHETQQVLRGKLLVENKMMSSLLADIHDFTSLGEIVWEEHLNSFLFDFLESAEEIAEIYNGYFEDQGDGFKILFRDDNHATRSLLCAMMLKSLFLELRSNWKIQNDAFQKVGLGIGICSDFMSVRRRIGSRHQRGHVFSHAINIAAAMSKYRTKSTDVEIYINDGTYSLLNKNEFEIDTPNREWLEKLNQQYLIYRVVDKVKPLEDQQLIKKEADKIFSVSPPLQSTITGEKIAILFLSSDPTDASRLRLGEEAREIQEKLQLAKSRERFTFHQRSSVRPEDISQALLDIEPQVVHFSGHGMSEGALCFEDKIGRIHPISPQALAALFAQFSDTVKCVVLNACYSEKQAKSISKHIDYVIGMQKEIGDKAAVAFAVGTYQALGAGKSFEQAYNLGCVQISLQGIEDEDLTPILLKRN